MKVFSKKTAKQTCGSGL